MAYLVDFYKLSIKIEIIVGTLNFLYLEKEILNKIK